MSEEQVECANRITAAVDVERRRWYAALQPYAMTTLEGLAPEVAVERVMTDGGWFVVDDEDA